MSSTKDYRNQLLRIEQGNPAKLWQRWSRDRFFAILKNLTGGAIQVRDSFGTASFGQANYSGMPSVEVEIFDTRFYYNLLMGGSMAAAEAYMAGKWSCTNLTELIRILIRSKNALALMDSGIARVAQKFYDAANRLRTNTISGSRRNIEAHYDLRNEFFQLFLDPTMAYSAGFFETDRSTLEEASVAKMDRICRKLQLTSNDHLLEIGTGWGSFALHAASKYGCRVTTTTISKAQYEYSKSRIESSGLSGKIALLNQDYRALEGAYDKLASIEMIEAVGHQYLGTFFKKCSELLRPNGRMALQAITIRDQEYDRYKKSVDFINRHIFPGGCLPSVTAMSNAMTSSSKLRIYDLDDMTSHYARTLLTWRVQFLEKLPKVRDLGFSERFIRMWQYYLCYCEAGFRERTINTVQMVLTRP